MAELTRLEALRAIERLPVDGRDQPGRHVLYAQPDQKKLRMSTLHLVVRWPWRLKQAK